MALDIRRLVRNLADLKHEKTNMNKFLKTKAKIKEYKENVKISTKEAEAIHDYIVRAEVDMGASSGVPPFEKDSFGPLLNMIADQFANISNGVDVSTIVSDIRNFDTQLEIGIVTTNRGLRYLTTRARAIQMGGLFQPISLASAKKLSKLKGSIK